MNRLEFRKVVEEKYTSLSRFKENVMNVSLIGQNKLKSVISKRLTKDNMDKVSELMSSNLCELSLCVLSKHTE